MREFCFFCQKQKDSKDWKFTQIETESDKKRVWICRLHFQPQYHEWTTEQIKTDRKKYFRSIIQPYRDGELAREFVEAYPRQARKMATSDQLRKSEYKWSDLPGWETRHQSQ